MLKQSQKQKQKQMQKQKQRQKQKEKQQQQFSKNQNLAVPSEKKNSDSSLGAKNKGSPRKKKTAVAPRKHLLNATLTQRSHQIARLAAKNDPRAESENTLLFSPDDMKEAVNT